MGSNRTKGNMRRLLPLLLAGAALLAAGCGTKHEVTSTKGTQRLSLMLDYFPNADHVGIYRAKAEGDFAKAGLDVQIQQPGQTTLPLKALEAGKVDLAISYEPELLLARDKGERVIAVSAIVQRPLTSIIAIGSKHIKTVADLRGKHIGTAGIPYQDAYLSTILARAHVPASSVKSTSVGFNLVPAMLSKKVDATLGGYWNYEGVQLAQKHKSPTIIRVDQAGVPTYDELVIVARQSELGTKGPLIRRFAQALGRGYQSARSDPEGAAAQIPSTDQKLQVAAVKKSLPAFFPPASKPFGWMDPAQWHAFGQWMLQNKLVQHDPHAESALTNEFLAGQGG
jgi:putative hydroxymethylpyrimidine transport system substrate-binding protein